MFLHIQIAMCIKTVLIIMIIDQKLLSLLRPDMTKIEKESKTNLAIIL